MSVSSDSDIFLEELPVIFIATYSRVVVSGLMLSNVSISPKSSSSSFSYAVSVSLSFLNLRRSAPVSYTHLRAHET